MLITGANAGIEPPVWNGAKPIPNPEEGLAYDWSPMTKVTGDRQQWVTELEGARTQVAAARTGLEALEGYTFPTPDRLGDVPQSIRDAVDGVRKNVFPKRSDLGDAKQEIPNYLPDGSIHPDDRVSTRLWDKPSVRMHLETALFRLPAADVASMNIAAIDDALRAAENVGYAITYQVKGDANAKDLPDVARTRKLLDVIDTQIGEALLNRGAPSKDAGPWARVGNAFQQLTVPQQRGVVAAAVLGLSLIGVGTGFALSNRMGD